MEKFPNLSYTTEDLSQIRQSCRCAEVAQSVQRLGYGLEKGVRFSRGKWWGAFSLRHRFQTASGDNPATCPIGTEGSYPVG